MIFEQVATGGCQSYLLGCQDTQAAVLIDPELSRIDLYKGMLARHGLSVKYIIDTHTHADHFSASKEMGKALGFQWSCTACRPRRTPTCGSTTATC